MNRTAPQPIQQNPDIRFLGRMLGDVIRAYGGEKLFRQTEYIRAASVDRHRGVGGQVDTGLEALNLDDTVAFVRGFMLFSLLANLAEDRQSHAQDGSATLSEAVARLQAEGIGAEKVGELLGQSLIVPVLTAHPTEVRRKSMIDHKNRIAALMRLRDAGQDVTDAGDRVEDAIQRQIALLWQTRPLRREKLVVADEIENARAYMEEVFLVALPKLYARWEHELGHRPPSFLRLGSWIGGDRDGNPFVNAQTLDHARRAAREQRSGIISTASIRWVQRFPSLPNWPMYRKPCWTLPTPAAIPRPAVSMNLIAVHFRVSMPACARHTRSLSAKRHRARRVYLANPTHHPKASAATSLPSPLRSLLKARVPCRAEALSAG